MALPGFGSVFHAAALINSILATALGCLTKPIILVLRLFALGLPKASAEKGGGNAVNVGNVKQ